MNINKFQKIAMFQTLFLTIVLSVTAQAAGIDPRVVQELTATGQVKTVIALNLPETAPNRLRAASVAMRDPIGETQEEVLNSLPTGSYELTYQYSHVPGLAMTVTPESFAILKDHPQVKYIQYDELEHIALAQAVPWIKADQVHSGSPAYNGNGITVAVLDTGINTSHVDFSGKIITQTCSVTSGNKCPPSNTTTGSSAEDDNGHGSHVSGIVAKVAPGTKIAAIKVCNNTGGCQASDTLAGLNWVIANFSSYTIKVVNMSIASSTLYDNSCDNDLRKTAIDSLINSGITVFAATGNNSNKSQIGAPACLSNTIAVGATYDAIYSPTATTLVCSKVVTNPDTASCFSNSSSWVDILAPGSEITSSWTGSTTATSVKAGTSMATPMASGVAALMLQKNSTLTSAQIKAKLKKTGVNVTDTNGITRPRIDALAAVNDANTTQPILEMNVNTDYLINSGSIDFGWTTIGSPVTKTLTLKNSGTAALTLNFSSLSSGFSLVSSFPITINANSQQTVQIELNATTANSYNGTLNFTTNDPVNSPIQIALAGKVCNLQTVPLSENFESGMPDCWRNISNDSSIRNWGVYGSSDISVINGSYSVATMSASTPMAVDDDWLILPRITLGNNSQLQFKARDEAGSENFEVKLSTTGNNVSDFTNLIVSTATTATAPATAIDYSYLLNGYAGQTVYLAIRNTSAVFNSSFLVVDDISVTDSSAPNYQNSTPTTSNITTSGFDLTVRLDEVGKVYYVVLLDTNSNVPNATQVKNGQDGTGTTTAVKASGYINVTSANSDFSKTFNTLISNTGYKIYTVSEDVSANLQTLVTATSVTTANVADTTPPIFNSSPSTSAITSSGFTVTVNSNEAGKAYYVVLPGASSTPTASNIKTEQTTSGTISGVITKGIINLSANTDINQAISGLSANTAYKIYVVLEDTALNLQTTATAISVTTNAIPDTTPPNFNSSPSISAITNSGFTLMVNSNEMGKAYYVVLLDSNTNVPNATQVKNGQDGTNTTTAVKASGSINLTAANNNFSKIISGLSNNSSYRVYVVLEDSAFNLQSTVPTVDATTLATAVSQPGTSPNYAIIERKDGTGSGQINSYSTGQPTWAPTIVMTATPDNGSVFVKWTGNIHNQDCYSDQPTIYVRLNAIKTCTATFDKITADNQSLVPVKLATYYLPGIENSGQAFIRIINTNSTPTTVKGTLYHATGQLLGVANSTLIQNLAPQATTELTIKDLAKLCSAPAWTGLAWLHITTPSGLNLLNLFENDNKTISNLTTVSTDNVLYNLPPSTNIEQVNILLINTSDKIQSVPATLYGANGQVLGKANTVLADVAARGIFSLSIKQLELLVGTQPWTDQVAKLQISTPEIKTMAILLSQDTEIVNLTPTHDNAAFNIPGTTNSDQALIYITNTSNSATTVTATLYHQEGYVLGDPNRLIINSLAPQATQVFSVSDLEKLFNVTTWQKRARLQINNPVTGIKVMTLIRNNSKISNLSSISNQVYYLTNTSHADKAYIRITNTTDSPVTVNGTVYGEDGQILGSGTLTPSLAGQTTTVLSMPLLENILKINGWTGEARLVVNPTNLQVMGTLRANTGQLLDMSDISHE